MKKSYKFGVKLTAGIVLIIMVMFMVTGTIGTLFAYEMDFYENVPTEFMDTHLSKRITNRYVYEELVSYLNWFVEDEDVLNRQYYLDRYSEKFSKENSNLRFNFLDSDGNVILSNCGGVTSDEYLVIGYTIRKADSEFYSNNNFTGKTYSINAYIDDALEARDDYYSLYRVYMTLYSGRYHVIVITIITAIICLLLTVFLCCGAGRNSKNTEVHKRLVDIIPYDIALAAVIIGGIAVCTGMVEIIQDTLSIFGCLMTAYAATLLLSLLTIYLVTSTAIRVKRKELLSSCISYRVLRLLWLGLKRLGNIILETVKNIHMMWKVIILLLGLGIAAVILVLPYIYGNGAGLTLFVGFLLYIAVSVFVCGIVLQFNTVRVGGERMAKGDFTGKIPVSGISSDVRKLAEHLNGINESLLMAVEERMKSERMKAELITNVSHDIKTPLTSIVSYVDLLKKENIDNEKAAEYIEVLDRQSNKLKKLINDLVEASKASTGNVSVALMPVNAVELLSQSVAEYSDRITEANLTPIISAPDEAVIMADGKLLWRVFDNALGNICKYSQAFTRVYINITEDETTYTICFKNISKDSLSISPDELMQRFVRGDSARTTEGSGLGLSIAQSLTELQGGTFSIDIDGDLFKVNICMNKAEKEQ